MDDILRERTAALKSDWERAKAALDRRVQCGTAAVIDARKIDPFARLMNEKLDSADTNARKGYIRSLIEAVEVDDNAIRIVGKQRCPPSFFDKADDTASPVSGESD